MAFELKASTCQSCGTVTFKDSTGTYDVDTNPTGYGGPGAPASPSDYDTYSLQVWAPGMALTDDPFYTLDLLPPPVATADGYYEYEITAEDLGLTDITSGIWYFRATAVDGATTYQSQTMPLFTENIQSLIDVQMLKVDPTSECACKGFSAITLNNLLTAAKFAACCGKTTKSQAIIDWLYRNHGLCCS